jgi:hypothetical protein
VTRDDGEVERTEVEAVLETRRELGSAYDAALVDSFADRIEAAVAARAAHDLDRAGRSDRERAAAGPRQLALGIVSCVAGVPVTAISLAVEGGVTGLAAMLIGWGGLVGINAAHALQSRRPADPAR